MASTAPLLVGDVLTRSALTVAASLAVPVVRDLLAGRGGAALPVLRGGTVVGVITRAELAGHEASLESAGSLMQRAVVLLREQDLLRDALAAMLREHAEHAVVVRDGRVVGVLRDEEAIRALAPPGARSAPGTALATNGS